MVFPLTAPRAFIVPRDLPGPSGGLVYNHRVQHAWRDMGLAVAQESVPGTWPRPRSDDRQALWECLSRYSSVLVDGIIASAAPEEIAGAVASGVQVFVLLHLPLPAESGLSPAERESLAASEQRALGAATAVVCTSDWARRDIAARYGIRGASTAAPGAQAAPTAEGSTPPSLLFLGAVTPRKNPLTLLQALRPLLDQPWSLTVAGPQHQDPAYAQAVQAAAEHFGERVEILGPVQGGILERLWHASDLLVLPALAETYGMVITEAIAHGIPAMVGADTGAEEALRGTGTRAVDDAGTPGMAIDPLEVSAWTAALASWCEQDTLRQKWRTSALIHRDRLRGWTETAKDLSRAIGW